MHQSKGIGHRHSDGRQELHGRQQPPSSDTQYHRRRVVPAPPQISEKRGSSRIVRLSESKKGHSPIHIKGTWVYEGDNWVAAGGGQWQGHRARDGAAGSCPLACSPMCTYTSKNASRMYNSVMVSSRLDGIPIIIRLAYKLNRVVVLGTRTRVILEYTF